MPRYMVERTFPDGLGITPTDEGARACLSVVENNAVQGFVGREALLRFVSSRIAAQNG